MKQSTKMKSVIEALAAKHSVDLMAGDAYLKLTMPHYMPLVIRNDGLHRVSVYHYFLQNGDVIPDPQIIFWVHQGQWYPIEITQTIGGHRSYVRLNDEGTEVLWLHQRAQGDLANFAQMWAQNIQDQGWLAHGERVQKALFPLGRVLITPGAQAVLKGVGIDPQAILSRHVTGDWVGMNEHDHSLNQMAVQTGEDRVFSAYPVTDDVTIWVITEADRSRTTLLLPKED